MSKEHSVRHLWLEKTAIEARSVLNGFRQNLKPEEANTNLTTQAINTLQFATTVMETLPIKEFLLTKPNPNAFVPRYVAIQLVGPSLWIRLRREALGSGVYVYPTGTVRFNEKNFPPNNTLKNGPYYALQNTIEETRDKEEQRLIKQLAKLGKRDVIKKFEKAIKI